jgi:hypothetical protein
MKRVLKKITVEQLRNDRSLRPEITGAIGDGLYGEVTGLSGNVTGLSGDVSGLIGNVDYWGITDDERKNGVNIADLIG